MFEAPYAVISHSCIYDSFHHLDGTYPRDVFPALLSKLLHEFHLGNMVFLLESYELFDKGIVKTGTRDDLAETLKQEFVSRKEFFIKAPRRNPDYNDVLRAIVNHHGSEWLINTSQMELAYACLHGVDAVFSSPQQMDVAKSFVASHKRLGNTKQVEIKKLPQLLRDLRISFNVDV